MSLIIVSHPLSCCTTWDSIPQVMFISFHVSGIHECHLATVLSNRHEEKLVGDQKGGEERKGATS